MILGISPQLRAQQHENIYLWPGKGRQAPELSPDTSHHVRRIKEVKDAFMTVYPCTLPGKKKEAVVVCPGGGYNILAIDLEGEEIAEWLNGLGYTAFVLNYRVPQQQAGALEDVQRAIRLVRQGAANWGIDPEKVGLIGFSAGGSLSARAATRYNVQAYTPVDKADTLSCKPAFAMLIYPAYLDQGPANTLTPELTLSADTPPMFLFATSDDPYGNSALVMAAALRRAKVPVELHFYNSGGHGYGLRAGNSAAAAWPLLAASWLKQLHLK